MCNGPSGASIREPHVHTCNAQIIIIWRHVYIILCMWGVRVANLSLGMRNVHVAQTLQHQPWHPSWLCLIAYSLYLWLCILFNLVMDPLLSKLSQKQLGLRVNGLFLSAHTDDIRDAKEQVTTVDSFSKSTSLDVCPEKCVLLHPSHQSTSTSIIFRLRNMPPSGEVSAWVSGGAPFPRAKTLS